MKVMNNWVIQSLVLGAVFFIAILLVKPIGVSTQFSVISGIVQETIDPETVYEDSETGEYTSENAYYANNNGKIASEIANPINYDMLFFLFIPIGGILGYYIFGMKDEIIDKQKVKLAPKELLIGFVGGFLILFGARMAGGCTSGHMMSGMLQSSVSGYIFAISVFVVGIPTAIILSNMNRGGK